MRHRVLAVLLAFTLLFSTVGAVGCGSSGSGHHALLKSVAGAVIVHHFLKKHGSKHALLKSVAAGAVIHHFVKRR
jgi:hypothetical protein